MAEAIHCPSCSTRYRLRPERLKPFLRRARCVTCQGVFPIGDVVQRLLASPSEAPAVPAAIEPPPLTLGDLEGTESEILEKTLVETPEVLPEAKPEAPAAPAFPPEITESTLSGYTSARDAIEKLFGDVPALAGEAKGPRQPTPMDFEATLSALENTLGGTHPTPPSPLPDAPEEPLPSTLAMPASGSTVRFTRDEVMAAMAEPAAAAPSEPTVALRAGDLLEAAAPRSAVPEATRAQAAAQTLSSGPLPIPAAPAPGTPEAELLRLKIGEEIYPGLTMPQLTQWVEEGRILEGHLVARQFSEHWIEAYKVPGLRPVFDRLRRERSPGPGAPTGEAFPTVGDPGSSKKSLFGGLFGGKN
ncbi:MAG TPA: zinc-ribbon domain-containing protein [Holophagaceae bacterium]